MPASGWSQDRAFTDAIELSKQLQSQGSYKQALTFAEKASLIGKGVLGATDPQVADLLDNLASIYMS